LSFRARRNHFGSFIDGSCVVDSFPAGIENASLGGQVDHALIPSGHVDFLIGKFLGFPRQAGLHRLGTGGEFAGDLL
jgi:hypothetical protein